MGKTEATELFLTFGALTAEVEDFWRDTIFVPGIDRAGKALTRTDIEKGRQAELVSAKAIARNARDHVKRF